MTEKTNVEDIIGLVQTDEPTNSVQLKKEAQLSICEKRIIELRKENERLKKEKNSLIKEYLHFKRNLLAAIYIMKELTLAVVF